MRSELKELGLPLTLKHLENPVRIYRASDRRYVVENESGAKLFEGNRYRFSCVRWCLVNGCAPIRGEWKHFNTRGYPKYYYEEVR